LTRARLFCSTFCLRQSAWGKALDYLIFALFPVRRRRRKTQDDRRRHLTHHMLARLLALSQLLWMIPVYFISLGLNFLKRKALAEKLITPEQRSLSSTYAQAPSGTDSLVLLLVVLYSIRCICLVVGACILLMLIFHW